MSDVERISALKGHRDDGEFGACDGAPGVVLSELSPSAIVQVNGAPSEEVLVDLFTLGEPLRAGKAGVDGAKTVLWNGPGKWIWVSTTEFASDLVTDLCCKLSPTGATVTALSHARTVVRVSGEQAPEVLCKGCPADLEGMSSGDCMATLIGTISALVHCREAHHVFDIYVFRSFGQAFWEWLTDAALEYGYSVSSQGR